MCGRLHSLTTIRARLYAAFAVSAGATVVCVALAVITFRGMETQLTRASTEAMPRLEAALDLSRAAERLSTLPGVLSSATSNARLAEEAQRMATARKNYAEKLAVLEQLGVDDSVVAALKANAQSFASTLDQLRATAEARNGMAQKLAAFTNSPPSATAATFAWSVTKIEVANRPSNHRMGNGLRSPSRPSIGGKDEPPAGLAIPPFQCKAPNTE